MQKCRFVGIPGSGKTTRGIEIISKVKDRGFSLQQVGYCTFTRAARREASSRAAEAFGVKSEDLEKNGWFRTIHSACMRLLRLPRGSIVNYDTDWLRKAVGDDTIDMISDEEDGEAWTSQWRGKSLAVRALSLWDVARNRLLGFDDVYDEMLYRMGPDRAFSLERTVCEEYIERYERAKLRDGRVDFCDCILRYAGHKMTLNGPQNCDPCGDVPPVPAWIFDECQDTSPLLDAAARRLSSAAVWWYLMGDKEQSIYEWSGANGNMFMRWDVVHEEYLRKTWRCAENIIKLGLRLIWKNDNISRDLKMLAVEPRCPGGTIETGYLDELTDHVDGRTPTLVMARTNQQVAGIQAQLAVAGIPWKSVRSGKRWPPIASTKTADAFKELANGGVIGGEEWRRIVAAVPVALLERGTKTKFLPAMSASEAQFVTLGSLHEYGGTDKLKECIAFGKWTEIVGKDEQFAQAARDKWGTIVDDPPTTVSTIHGTKGMEAEKVVLSTGIGGPVLANLRTPEGQEEERRVWYVGLTRARDHLVLLKQGRNNYQDIYDAMEE